ncbi:MAG: hypothetical protein ABW167_09185, partial [Baekduia sp.]
PLRALRADPLARYTPPGARLVDERTTDQRSGGLLGKPREARYERLYAVGGAPVAAYGDAVVAANRAGWELDVDDGDVTGRNVALLSKTTSSGRSSATITLLRSADGLPDGVRPPVLSVVLLHHGSS